MKKTSVAAILEFIGTILLSVSLILFHQKIEDRFENKPDQQNKIFKADLPLAIISLLAIVAGLILYLVTVEGDHSDEI